MAYAAEWDLDDQVLDREEVEAIVQHVAALGHVAAEVSRSRRGLSCTFRVPVAAAADVVTALDPGGRLLGDDWYRDLDPPLDGDDGYVVQVDLLGPVDGGRVDDDELSVEDWEAVWRAGDALRTDPDDDLILDPGEEDEDEADDDDGDDATCVARLRIEALDNREAWPVAFALANAIVERLGGDLRDDGATDAEAPESSRALDAATDEVLDGAMDEDLFRLQLHVPRVTGPAVGAGAAAGGGVVTSVGYDDEDELLN